ncbi:hypothetical protein SUGI_0679720 [Cryptomeria japonica]|uniref:trihelix transcription factor GTL1 n=1 Tax=Cryptomeria japonica TaxID=3369 RepID=UPI0024148E61|nr:trihelix transcription factor GTL1 [Cryptomeria japonica]GLJ33806.1 hypothetical protein SUGI_0679720 [Cryptomeria japonica]
MQSGMEYHGSAPDQIQQFVVGRGVVHIPSLMFGTLSNPHGNFPSQAKQAIQQQGFQAFDPVENPNCSTANIKQKIHVAQEGCTDEDVSAVGDPGDKNSEANRWPREETLALLRIRADMDANLKDSTVKGPVWETVSRKLAELGFYRSAKKCKEKFENVNKYYKKTKDGRINRQDGKAYRFCSELEALHAATSAKNSGIDNPINGLASNENIIYNKNNPGNSTSVQIEEISRQAQKTTLQSSSETGYNSRQNMSSDDTSVEKLGEPNSDEHDNVKKRKRKQKMGTMKAFLENMVQQVLEHQETLQQKLLEAIEKRDDDRLKREESWKRQEMARLNRQTEQRAQEHALQSSREKAIISFLNKFTGENFKLDPQAVAKSSGPNVQEDGKYTDVRESSDPRCKRWPKSEVYALIQLRSEMEQRFKESGPKVALWEEISSAMAIMGLNRSAKRCKEKWENINKYFRKTKGSFKKRPLNTKTCPYFHQLDTLYRKGLLLSPGNAKFENNLDNHNSNSGALANIHKDDHQGKSNEVQINNQDSGLLSIIPSPNQASIPTTNTASESMEFLAQKKMKWNNNFIDTMDNQTAALKSRPVDEFSLSNMRNTHSRRFKMDGLDKDNSRRPQIQQHIFFNGFDRRDQEGDLTDLEGNHQQHQQQKIQINQVLQPAEEQHSHANVSQSALMALVHKLSASYPICPPATE